jgi:hypothetical protein
MKNQLSNFHILRSLPLEFNVGVAADRLPTGSMAPAAIARALLSGPHSARSFTPTPRPGVGVRHAVLLGVKIVFTIFYLKDESVLLQGDHGPVEYRNIVITSAKRAR